MSMSEYMKEVRREVGNRLLEVPSVSVITRDERGRVLLVRHENDGAWTTPGGAIEPTEVPADAAVREMWEETGLQVQITRILGVYGGPEFIVTYRNGDRTSYVMVVFEGRWTAGKLRADGVETLDVRYFTLEETRAVSTATWLREILEDVFAQHPHASFRAPRWSPPPAA